MTDRLDEIQQRLEAATPGKWHIGGIAYNNVVLAQQDEPDGEVGYQGMWPVYPCYGPRDDRKPQPQESANLDLIAHAPDDIRWLKAIVDNLRDKLAKHEGHFGLNVSQLDSKIQLRCFDRTHSGRNVLLFSTRAAAQAAVKESKP